jgi:hypothetical protein
VADRAGDSVLLAKPKNLMELLPLKGSRKNGINEPKGEKCEKCEKATLIT